MNQDEFIRSYISRLKGVMADLIDPPGHFESALEKSIMALLRNDGVMSNKDRFFKTFTHITGLEFAVIEKTIHSFYQNEYSSLDGIFEPDPHAVACVKALRKKGYMTVLATNPLYPRMATLMRLSWAGLEPEDFDYISTYENSSYCKPNLKYYEEILQRIDRKATDCLMVGNDVIDDMCVSAIGMETFFLDTYLINGDKEDLTRFPSGNSVDLLKYIDSLPNLKGRKKDEIIY